MDSKQKYYISSVFTGALFLLSFFLSTNSLWFTLAMSLTIGSGYFLLCKTQPQFMMIISILIQYQINKIKFKYNKFILWAKPSLNSDQRIRLQKEKNFNFLEYYDTEGLKGHKKYIYLFNEKLRSNDVIIFRDENGHDITTSIEPYLGPMQNFHGVPLTPGNFNHKKITIFRDGDICMLKVFEENEPLIMIS